MVAPIREIGNKLFLSSANTDSTTYMTLPTVSASVYIGMDFDNAVRNSSDNYNKVRVICQLLTNNLLEKPHCLLLYH